MPIVVPEPTHTERRAVPSSGLAKPRRATDRSRTPKSFTLGFSATRAAASRIAYQSSSGKRYARSGTLVHDSILKSQSQIITDFATEGAWLSQTTNARTVTTWTQMHWWRTVSHPDFGARALAFIGPNHRISNCPSRPIQAWVAAARLAPGLCRCD